MPLPAILITLTITMMVSQFGVFVQTEETIRILEVLPTFKKISEFFGDGGGHWKRRLIVLLGN